MPTGDVVSESPVEIKLPNDGLLNANRMKSEQNGDLITFTGEVEVTLNPEQLHPTPEEAPAPPTVGATRVVRRETGQPSPPEISPPGVRN